MSDVTIDGAGPIRRFFKIALPLIAPVSFFLLVVNLVYAFFDTFPVIDAATSGGPVQATTTLIYSQLPLTAWEIRQSVSRRGV